jgi:hypothetical protein
VWDLQPFVAFWYRSKAYFPQFAMGFPNNSGISAPFCANLKCHNYNIFKEQMQELF